MEVYVMRGLPGSGKTTYIRNNFKDVTVCSADSFFETGPNGEYQFDPTKLPQAHQECFKKYLRALAEERPLIVVDNTGSRTLELSPYVLAGESFGASVTIVEVRARIETCCRRNVHKVPEHAIGAMAEAMRRETLPPWWRVKTYDNNEY